MAKIDVQKAIAYLKDKWKSPCPMCGVSDWSVGESTFQLTEFRQGSMVLGGPVIPVVPVTCSNCGNTILVNAITAKLVEKGARP